MPDVTGIYRREYNLECVRIFTRSLNAALEKLDAAGIGVDFYSKFSEETVYGVIVEVGLVAGGDRRTTKTLHFDSSLESEASMLRQLTAAAEDLVNARVPSSTRG